MDNGELAGPQCVARRWCFTAFDTDQAARFVDAVANQVPELVEKIKYLVCQWEEAPSTGRRHLQGYIELRSPQRLGYLRKLVGNGVHAAQAKGTAEHNRAYCTKEESRVAGTEPYTYGVASTQGHRSDISSFVQSIKRGGDDRQLVDDHPTEFMKYARVIDRVRQAVSGHRDPQLPPIVKVYWGETGTGKTRTAYEELPGAYMKHGDIKWWDGYNTGQNVIWDDFVPSDAKISDLLVLLDRYPNSQQVCNM